MDEVDGAEFLVQAPPQGGLHISVWDTQALAALTRTQLAKLSTIVDTFGKLSAKAQGLSGPVTDWGRLRSNGHVLYLASTATSSGRSQVLGGLKIGRKLLFLHSPRCDKYLEINPDCVLDFYVHESCQRSGIGRRLLETFLQHAGQKAAMLAYDRPSPKLKAFLAKHYGLASFVPQVNNYVVFNELLETAESAARQKSVTRSVIKVDTRAGTAYQSAAARADAQLGARAASSPSAVRCAVQLSERPGLTGGAHHAEQKQHQAVMQRHPDVQTAQPPPSRLPQLTALPRLTSTSTAARSVQLANQQTSAQIPATIQGQLTQLSQTAPLGVEASPSLSQQQEQQQRQSATMNAAALASQQLWEAALRQAASQRRASVRRPFEQPSPSAPAAAGSLAPSSKLATTPSASPGAVPRRPLTSGDRTPLLRTPWALRITEDVEQSTPPQRLMPARRADLSLRSKAPCQQMPQFQLAGSVASR